MGSPGTSERQLAEALAARGRGVSLSDIAGWRRAGLLPQLAAHGLGPGKGRAHCWHEDDIIARAELVHDALERTGRADTVLISLFLAGYPVALAALRRAFANQARMRKPAPPRTAPRPIPVPADSESLFTEALLAMGGVVESGAPDFAEAARLLERALARLGFGRRARTSSWLRALLVMSLGLETSAVLKSAADSELLEAQSYLTRGLLALAPLSSDRRMIAGNFGVALFLFTLALLRAGQGAMLDQAMARMENIPKENRGQPVSRPAPALHIHA